MRLPRWLSAMTRTRARFTSGPVDQAVILNGITGVSGARMSRADALTVPAVLRGRNLLCSVATLPLLQRAPDKTVVANPLFTQLDPDVPNVVTLAMTVEDLVFDAIAWWRILDRGWDGFPVSAQRLDPQSVSLQAPANGGSPANLPGGTDPHGASVWIDGVRTSERDVIRFDSPNPAVLVAGARAIRRALLFDRAAAMYADDPRPLDYFTPADGADPLEDDEARAIIAQWRAARKERGTGWIPGSLTYHSVDAPSPADLQLVELKKDSGLELANSFGVDPEDLGISTTSRTYQNDVDRRRARVNDVYSPYMRAITDRLSMGDVTKRGYLVKFDLNDYMKSNPTERATVQKMYLDMGVISVDEIRDAEDYAGPAPGTEPAAPDDPSEAAAMDAARRALVHLSAPTAAHFITIPDQTFAVDLSARTIKGTVLPYGKYARTAGFEIRFAPGSLQYTDLSRIKLLRDHDPSAAIGYAVKATDTRAGLVVEFKVARGAAGDEALVLAEDGVLDGFSVGVDFDAAVDAVTDPKRKNALMVNRAHWRETSLTAMPAFDDARVTSVAASLTGGTMHECQTCGQVHAAGVACTPPAAPPATPPAPVTLTNEQFSAFLAAANRLEAAPAPPEPPAGPAHVSATRQTAATFVREPTPYRFDRRGNLLPAAHEFSADLISGLRDSDTAAYQRALGWVQAQFDVVTTDVNELNPTGQRPDMYVDQRTYRYPVWEAIVKGTLANNTPFAFPKFSSASGLVAAHVEGVEPTSGTFVTTSATVTPTGLSGKAKISRETWDQGGNPQIGNLIWQQMLKGWYEALEAAAVAVLDAASPTGIDFSASPGLANDDLDQALTAAFADLQFVRGGFTMDNMFTQIDLYKALVAAVSADGRRLYPALGPTNAGGTVASRFGSLDINGVTAYPAWALAATGSVVASSYLFDSAVVHGWASAPQRLTIDQTEVANVYLGIWGYKATVISDVTGVREILYDPA
jgi:HK97 family phage prohead protease